MVLMQLNGIIYLVHFVCLSLDKMEHKILITITFNNSLDGQ